MKGFAKPRKLVTQVYTLLLASTSILNGVLGFQHTVLINGEIGRIDTQAINKSVMYVYQFPLTKLSSHLVASTQVFVKEADTILFDMRRESYTDYWTLPLITSDNKRLTFFNKSICTGVAAKDANYRYVWQTNAIESADSDSYIMITVTTKSLTNIDFHLLVSQKPNILELNKSVVSRLRLVSPNVFFVQTQDNSTSSSLLKLSLSSAETSCAIVSIQTFMCPFLDNLNTVKYRGIWFTMTTTGAITLKREDYPNGFYVVVLMHENDEPCQLTNAPTTPFKGSVLDRTKFISYTVSEPITNEEMHLWILATLILLSSLTLTFFLVPCFVHLLVKLNCFPKNVESLQIDQVLVGESQESLENVDTEPETNLSAERHQSLVGDAIDATSDETHLLNPATEEQASPCCGCFLKIVEVVYNFVEFLNNKFHKLTKFLFTRFQPNNSPKLSKMMLTTTSPEDDSQSSSFFWFTLAVLFYFSMPAVQMVIFDVTPESNSTSMDTCFYNFNCSFPMGEFYAANNVISALAFLFFGVASFLVFALHYFMSEDKNPKTGVSSTLQFSFTLSCTLIALGVSSATHSMCPTEANNHFSASLIYIAITLSGVQMYSKRHPTTSMGPVTTMLLLSGLEILDFNAKYFPKPVYFIVFSVIYASVWVMMAMKLLCHGTRSFSHIFAYLSRSLSRNNGGSENDNACEPRESLDNPFRAGKDVQHLVLLGFLVNGVIIGLEAHLLIQSAKSFDFGNYILVILISNGNLYIFYYIFMKLAHGEQITVLTAVNIVFAIWAWAFAISHAPAISTWVDTPAVSRTLNKDCTNPYSQFIGGRFFGPLDWWRLSTSLAVGLTLAVLHNIDAPLQSTTRENIAVF